MISSRLPNAELRETHAHFLGDEREEVDDHLGQADKVIRLRRTLFCVATPVAQLFR